MSFLTSLQNVIEHKSRADKISNFSGELRASYTALGFQGFPLLPDVRLKGEKDIGLAVYGCA